MFYSGESNVPGAPGNLLAGSPSFDIGPRSPFKGMSQEQLNKLKEWDQRPGDLQKYYEKINAPGPKLPFAMGAYPNAMIAQAYPGGQDIGNAAALGGQVGINPRQYQQMMEMVNMGGRF